MRDRESARESERERRERKEREREREREREQDSERASEEKERGKASVGTPHTCASDMRNASTTFPRAACNYSLNPQP